MWIGERRFTSSTRSICSRLYSLSFPVPGSPAFATSTSTSPTSPQKALDRAGVREVERARLRAVAELGDELVEHLGPPPGEDQMRAARVQRARDRLADAAGGARQEDPANRSARLA